MKLSVGDKDFSVKVADNEESRRQGLRKVKAGSMPKSAGLVLKYDIATPVTITMKEMKFPIDVIFIRNDVVQKVVAADPDQEDISIGDVSDFVLEVPRGSGDGLKEGDKVSWSGEKLKDGTIQMAEGGAIAVEGALQVLDENGKVQSNIEGDERIFSRKHTERLCELAECAHNSKSNNDYKKLGMAMMRMIDKQDTQEPEYTKT